MVKTDKIREKYSICGDNKNKAFGLTTDEMNKLEEDSDDILDEKKLGEKKSDDNDDDDDMKGALERFRVEDYELLAPSLIKVFEAFLDLEKRSTFGSGLTAAATSMMSWFFNGYIANKLYNQTASFLTMDGSLSYLMQWISDLIWIPPKYEMFKEDDKLSTDLNSLNGFWSFNG